jgi:hypothetical protein
VRAQEPLDPASEIRYATYLSYALTDAGESERAERLLGDLAEEPLEAVDSYTRVRLFWSLGRVATREGRTLSGLAYFRRAIALLETTEDTLHLARAHVSCAWALSKSGRAQEAGGHLEVAEQLFGRKPTLPILAGCVPKRPSERSLSARASRRSLIPSGRRSSCWPATVRAETVQPPIEPGRSFSGAPVARPRRSTYSSKRLSLRPKPAQPRRLREIPGRSSARPASGTLSACRSRARRYGCKASSKTCHRVGAAPARANRCEPGRWHPESRRVSLPCRPGTTSEAQQRLSRSIPAPALGRSLARLAEPGSARH